jgi:hypothetical protein
VLQKPFAQFPGHHLKIEKDEGRSCRYAYDIVKRSSRRLGYSLLVNPISVIFHPKEAYFSFVDAVNVLKIHLYLLNS